MNLPTENNLTLMRKYFHEVVLFGLTTCVIYLFIAYNNLNIYIRDNLTTSTVNTITSIKENTEVLRETNQILLKIKNK